MKIYVCRCVDLLNLEGFEIIYKTLEEAIENFNSVKKYDKTTWILLGFEIDEENPKLDFNEIIYINYDKKPFYYSSVYEIIDKF